MGYFVCDKLSQFFVVVCCKNNDKTINGAQRVVSNQMVCPKIVHFGPTIKIKKNAWIRKKADKNLRSKFRTIVLYARVHIPRSGKVQIPQNTKHTSNIFYGISIVIQNTIVRHNGMQWKNARKERENDKMYKYIPRTIPNSRSHTCSLY